jgi:hypothetical protein
VGTVKVPTTEAELRALLESGLLIEDHHTDFKREVGSGEKANREFAKDVAALAIDGGAIYVGVDESEGGPPVAKPVPLEGLKERLDQIARMAPKPGVPITCTTLPVEGDPLQGFMVVTVRPSADAPHMVDGRYVGRSDTTTYALTDAEVLRLHQRRAVSRDAAEQLLDAEIARDPAAAGGLNTQAHIFVVAQPLIDDDELLLRSLPAGGFRSWLSAQLASGPVVKGAGQGYSPDVGSTASQLSWRAHGFAVHTWCISPERGLRPNGNHPIEEDDLLDLEVREDGGLRLFCGRASDTTGPGLTVLFPGLIIGLTHRVLVAARVIADQSGYLGGWSVGVALTNMQGLPPWTGTRFSLGAEGAAFSEPSYRQVTHCTLEEIETESRTVCHRLLGRLQRALNVQEWEFDVINKQI